jgi:hypothetical protein
VARALPVVVVSHRRTGAVGADDGDQAILGGQVANLQDHESDGCGRIRCRLRQVTRGSRFLTVRIYLLDEFIQYRVVDVLAPQYCAERVVTKFLTDAI